MAATVYIYIYVYLCIYNESRYENFGQKYSYTVADIAVQAVSFSFMYKHPPHRYISFNDAKFIS